MLSYMLLLFHHYFLLFRHYFLLFHHYFLDFYTTFWIDPTPKFNEHRLNACPRHGDLCHLSPQLLKKKFAFLCILPRKRHRRRQDSNPPLLDRRSILCRWAIEPLTRWRLLPDFIYVIYIYIQKTKAGLWKTFLEANWFVTPWQMKDIYVPHAL